MLVNIFDYGMNGEGIGKLDGKIVLVPGALVGETVEIEIVKSQPNYAEAKLLSVKESSKERVNQQCNLSECGGCLLKHFSYNEQLKFKQQLVKKTIKKIANIDVDVNPTVASKNQFNYRNKVSFAVGDSVGFFKQNSHEIVPIDCCNLADENVNKVLKIFKNWYDFSKNLIKNLVIRSLNNQILVGVVTKQEVDLSTFYQALKTEFISIGLYQIINTRNDSVVLAGKVKHIGGIKQITLNNFGINYSIDIMSFHQTNEDIQNKIYAYVLSKIEPTSTIINAYSGAGLLSAIIAKQAKKVYGVELNKSAHLLAKKLKKDNDIKNLSNVNADFIKFLSSSPKADILILDPPKKGCGKEIEKVDTKRIIYISCNPISLAKDLQKLTNKYIIEEITPFDMFPNTTSVETVVILRRK